MSGAQRRKARYLCCQALYQWRLSDHAPEKVVAQFLDDHVDILYDELYFSKLFLSITQHKKALEEVLSPLIGETLLTPIEEIALWIGAYELMFLKDIPLAVVIHEALLVSKKYGTQEGYTFVNAILDQLAKQVRCDGS